MGIFATQKDAHLQGIVADSRGNREWRKLSRLLIGQFLKLRDLISKQRCRFVLVVEARRLASLRDIVRVWSLLSILP